MPIFIVEILWVLFVHIIAASSKTKMDDESTPNLCLQTYCYSLCLWTSFYDQGWWSNDSKTTIGNVPSGHKLEGHQFIELY